MKKTKQTIINGEADRVARYAPPFLIGRDRPQVSIDNCQGSWLLSYQKLCNRIMT